MQLPKMYAGRILSIDLTNGKSEILDTADYAELFLGGRGIAAKLYWDQVPSSAGALEPENRLIFSLGPMAGLPAIGASRWGIFAKSPFPKREHFCYGSLGGYFGAELKSAGYDGLVVHGRAEKPSVLAIEGDAVSVKPAEGLWGKSTVETLAALKRANPGIRALAIGPAGENLVPYATVFADGDSSCSGGMGAVMGSKNLKAVTVKGGRFRLLPADPEALRSIENEIRGYGRGNVKAWGIDFMAHGEKTKKLPCYGCMAKCLRVSYTADNGTSGKFMCQSRFFYMQHAWGYYGTDTDVPFLANRLCDEYGLDTWETQAVIEWLLRCHAEGIISEEESGLPLSKVGSLEFIEDLVRGISRKEGFGAVLAAGADRASEEYGRESRALFRHNDPYDPRYCTNNILLLPFEKREPIQQLHEAGLVLAQWSSRIKGVEGAHISTEVLRGIAEKFWGGEKAADLTTFEGKALAAKSIQDRQIAKECLGLCDWMYPLIDNPKSPDHLGDPSVESRILSAASGKEYREEDLYRAGERVFNLQRAVLLREGHRALLDDVLPEEYHTQALETHVADPECIVPGPGGSVVSMIGVRIDMERYVRLREEYYGLRGWDVKTGLQSAEALAALGLSGEAAELLALGLAVPRARRMPLLRRSALQRGFRRDQRVFLRERDGSAVPG
ncbi:MAG: hypothetical protein E4H36_15405, partial [Spirochaetales bacterium]